MSRPISDYKRVLKLLEELHREYPSFDMMRHIDTATSDYGNAWGMSDKELLYLLNKYRATLELDRSNIVDDAYVARIVQDANNFDDILKEDEEEYGD